ncbi:class IV adenylate cyclase [Clostridium cellulovorans]|uniref:Adenylate cyclase n=1 Tax=Clostridium cellulovorans (strain ATCC 35296 / DSM 3052 / OCM 3 / 743B) TaxID=573061 RepID=D9SUB6_CLOC7|nr:CYTH domain-containing protein [Clostridium cellulovorans]ADL52871.1 adenylate cyclase [Clostridium cellulovorans 743B]
MNELETKIIDISVDDIKDKLANINATLVKKENQINYIFDFEDRRLLAKKGYARVRVVEDLLHNKSVTYMTTKRLISEEVYKLMEENETIIDDSEAGIKIFKSLGLLICEEVKKYRESYSYKNTLVEIDINDKSFCPFPYLEIESESEDEVAEIVNLLGYTMADTNPKSIYEIMNDKGL